MRMIAFLAFAILCRTALADTLVLQDGRVIEWKTVTDKGDLVEIEKTDGTTISVRKEEIAKVTFSTTKGILTGATFTPDTKKSGAPVNLIGLVEPKRDILNGEWKLAGGGLLAISPSADVAYRVAVPYTPPDEYDLEVTVERKDGEGGVIVGLMGGGRQFGFEIDGNKVSMSGIACIDGQWPGNNPTGVAGRLMVQKKPRPFVISVRKDFVRVMSEGKEILNWKADYQKVGLAAGYLPAAKNHLFLVVYSGNFAFSKLVLTPKK